MTFIFIVALVSIASITDASSVSEDMHQWYHRAVGRALLQATKECPIDFESMNYTVVTSECKGPKYEPEICCEAFKKLACPVAEQLNDVSNQCATTLFSYINLYGKYPPGLFSNECHEGKEGLACPLTHAPPPAAKGGAMKITESIPLLHFHGLLLLLLLMLCLFFIN